MKDKTRPGVCYCRVSTQDQQAKGYSMPAQLRSAREYAFRNGVRFVKEFEEAESAAKEGRPRFRELLRFVRAQREPMIVVIDTIDRLTRNTQDLAKADQLVEAGHEFHSVRDGTVVSLKAAPHVRYMFRLQAIGATLFSENLACEARKGMLQKRLEGGWTHRAPIGLSNTSDERGRKVLEVDAERAPLVARVASRYLEEGETQRSVTRFAESIGLRSRKGNVLSSTQVATLLRHPVLAGFIPVGTWIGSRCQGDEEPELIPGQHPAVIEPELWRRIQVKLDTRVRRTRQTRPKHAYAGLLRCAHCDGAITPQRVKRKKRDHTYYQCWRAMPPHRDCEGLRVKEETITEALAGVFGELEVDRELIECLRDGIVIAEAEARRLEREERRRIERELKSLAGRVTTAYGDRLRGRISGSEYDAVKIDLEDNEARLRARLELLETMDRQFQEEALLLLRWCSGARQAFLEADDDERRTLIKKVLETPRLDGDSVIADWAELFQPIALAVQSDREVVLVGNARCEKWLRSADLNRGPSG